jgi:hypothetical protein
MMGESDFDSHSASPAPRFRSGDSFLRKIDEQGDHGADDAGTMGLGKRGGEGMSDVNFVASTTSASACKRNGLA